MTAPIFLPDNPVSVNKTEKHVIVSDYQYDHQNSKIKANLIQIDTNDEVMSVKDTGWMDIDSLGSGRLNQLENANNRMMFIALLVAGNEGLLPSGNIPED